MVSGIDISIPFECPINPEYDRSAAEHLQWILRADLVPQPKARAVYESANFPLLVAYTYPYARGPALDLITNLMGWSFLFDDSLDKPGILKASTTNTAKVLNVYRNVMDGVAVDSSGAPLIASWKELFSSVRERSSDEMMARHRTNWERLFEAFQEEAENNAQGIVPGFQDYLELRRGAGGVDICLDWAEAICGFELPSLIHKDPDFLQLRECVSNVVAMTNDIFSVRKEHKGGNTDNVVLVLAKQEQCTWQHAVKVTEGLIEKRVVNFQKTEERFQQRTRFSELSQQQKSNTFKFLDSMRCWMRGSLEWHLTSPRYR